MQVFEVFVQGFAKPSSKFMFSNILLTFFTSKYILKYRIRTNIGKELNLANWQTATQSPSLNLANIFV